MAAGRGRGSWARGARTRSWAVAREAFGKYTVSKAATSCCGRRERRHALQLYYLTVSKYERRRVHTNLQPTTSIPCPSFKQIPRHTVHRRIGAAHKQKFEMVRLTLLSAILFVVAVDAYAPGRPRRGALSTRRRTVTRCGSSFIPRQGSSAGRACGLWYATCASSPCLITQEKASSNKVARTSGFRNPFVLPGARQRRGSRRTLHWWSPLVVSHYHVDPPHLWSAQVSGGHCHVLDATIRCDDVGVSRGRGEVVY